MFVLFYFPNKIIEPINGLGQGGCLRSQLIKMIVEDGKEV
jgi:hypothetical protein